MQRNDKDPSGAGGCPLARSSSEPPNTSAPQRPHGAWPPGPRTWFTGWGVLRQLASDTLGQLPRWQAQYGDLVHLHIPPYHLVFVMHPSLARELLVNQGEHLVRWDRIRAVFAQAQGNGVLVAEGADWKRKRKALNPTFSPAEVQALLPTIGWVTLEAFQQWPIAVAARERWPIEEELTALTMDVIARVVFSSAMGEESRQARRDLRVITEAANREFYVSSRLLPAWLPLQKRKRRSIAQLNDFIRRHIDVRVRQPEDSWPEDLLTRLLRLHRSDPEGWPIQAVHDECMTAFQAGHETVASTLTWWSWCMASNPEWQERIAREVRSVLHGAQAPASGGAQWQALLSAMPLLMASIQESMRLYPAVPLLMSRVNERPVTLDGWTFPAGTQFLISPYVGQHDKRWLESPEVFNPERFMVRDDGESEMSQAPRSAWMAFGVGPRICLGQHLAMAEMGLIGALLLQRWRLSVPTGMRPPQPHIHVTLRPYKPLTLLISARD